MNQKIRFALIYASITAIFFPILVSSSAKSETIPLNDELIISETLPSDREISSPRLLTGIQVNSTENGIEIILQQFSD